MWKVITDDGTFAVRCWPHGWSRVRLEGLHALFRFVNERGVDFVSVPLLDRTGATLIEHGGRYYQVEPWLPGLPDPHTPPSNARLTAAMQALARWHLAAVEFTPAAAHRQWFLSAASQNSPAIVERYARLRALTPAQLQQWTLAAQRHAPAAAELVQRLVQRVALEAPQVLRMLDVARTVLVPIQPALRDVWRDHVLFTDDRVTGLIDPSACRVESVAADLARLLGSLCGSDRSAWDFALNAYQQQRPLSLAEQGLITVLDRSGVLLTAVTWLEWLGEKRILPNDSRVLPRLTDLVTRLCTCG